MNKIILIAFVFILVPAIARPQAQTDIDSLSRQKETLDSLLDLKQSEVDQLYLIDEQLSLTSSLIRKLERRLRDTESRLAKTSRNIDSSEIRLEKMKSGLARNLRSFYINYRPAPAALFTAGDIRKAARQLHYFKSTVNYLHNQIDTVNQIKSDLEQSRKNLIRMRAETRELVQRKNLEESLLEMRRKDKSRLVSRIDNDVSLRREYLNQARRDQEQLADLTEQLDSDTRNLDFASLKGKLNWPLKGRIIRHFGREYDQVTRTETFSPGIQISVPGGSEVHSAESGTVVHSDYLRGYGNMVIVDHGDGWYTLYGHLGRIEKLKGDRVERGELLGYSGESGSNVGPVLFFGIRNRETSFDPVEWLK